MTRRAGLRSGLCARLRDSAILILRVVRTERGPNLSTKDSTVHMYAHHARLGKARCRPS